MPEVRNTITTMVWYAAGLSIDELLCHGWVACEHPERPPDRFVGYHTIKDGESCRACTIAREAAARSGVL